MWKLGGVALLVLLTCNFPQVAGGDELQDETRLAGSSKVKVQEKLSKKKVRFTVRLRLPARKVDDLLGDKSGAQYQELSRVLARDIEQLYADIPGEHKVYNLKLSTQDKRHRAANEMRDQHATPSTYTQPRLLLTSSSSAPPVPSTSRSPDNKRSPDAQSKNRARKRKKQSTTKGKKVKLQHGSKISSPVASTAQSTVPVSAAVSSMSRSDLLMTSSVPPRDRKFDVTRLTSLFKNCLTLQTGSNDYIIPLHAYISAYNELLGIFTIFGPIFSFAGDDIRSKLVILNRLRAADSHGKQSKYESLQSMFEYEYSPAGATADTEGVSATRWLHRAMTFILEVINGLRDETSDESMSSKAKVAYDEVLAPHHEWYVKVGVHIALLSFPSRASLLEKMGVPDDQTGQQMLGDLYSVMEAVHQDIHKLYAAYAQKTAAQ
ncbi:glycolipid transfer protein domain-containing protein 2-like [Physella acuta]|uniref:glycolipid transfer protein domain-containing protein 2-like n=1 Tax=Physella acuta TaxID=109671 RepID=UPI0027DBA0A6|nr:glycolipid transfer protein domain-containing protein 2-like [Physella acuta]